MSLTDRRVLVIGIDPYAVAHLGIDPELVTTALNYANAHFDAAGIPVDTCLVGLDQSLACDQITEQLRGQEYACVVIGGGIRKPEPMLEFFEAVLNVVHRLAPTAAMAFNTNAENSIEAARRWLGTPADGSE